MMRADVAIMGTRRVRVPGEGVWLLMWERRFPTGALRVTATPDDTRSGPFVTREFYGYSVREVIAEMRGEIGGAR